MENNVFIFPGQGSQYVGMGKELAYNFSSARRVFEMADEALGRKLSDIIFSGTEDELRLTENTQPAIVAVSIACLEVLREHGLEASAAAGLSLGEYSALISAGSMSVSDALPLVQKRGRYMQEAVPPGVGGMAALLGLERSKVIESCLLASDTGVVEPANYNSPDQIVISGEITAVRRACEIAKGMGAKRAVELPVSVSFHCSLLKSVEPRLARDLEAVDVLTAKMPVVANISADYITSPSQIRTALIFQVSNAVLWQDSMEKLIRDGYNTFIEVGPGKALTGLMKKINPNVWVHQVEDRKSLEKVLSSLDGKEGENFGFGG
ncbi:MAG: ACP S-malonyltransferase [Dethiobacter sp.]|jgi:[acyl-carrier-protein] S-malonyltransferase|nr:ACP S-malonyltransferase [Dethiobacter sp.]